MDIEAVKAWAKRWRDHEAEYGLDGCCAHEAMDQVEALVAEVERLREEIAEMREEAYHSGIERDLAD